MKILNELLEEVSVLESHGNVDVSVSSVTLNSKEVEQNSVFVALVGNVIDGHNFIGEVIQNGAKAIIHEHNLKEYQKGITYIKVADTHKVVGIIAGNFYDNPSRKLKLIGITGTNGKTTIVTLLHQLFYKLGYKVGMIGTIVNKINDKSFEAERTTPDAITLNKILSDMVNADCEYCFMEVSSHSVSEKRISNLSFIGGLFTNLTLDHLDYHKTFENYFNAKKKFFEMLPPTGFAIANIDDPKGEYMINSTKAQRYTLSLKKFADFNKCLETKLIGEFNAYNVLGIYAVAVLLLGLDKPVLNVSSITDIDKEKVKEIIKTLDSVPGRFQSIKSTNNITGIVDYAHTPDALENVLKTINELKNFQKPEVRLMASHKSDLWQLPRIITVVGCGGDRDKSKRPIMARIAYDMSDILILTSDNPRTEKPENILNDMQKGLSLESDDKVEIIINRHMAIKKACELAKDGDFILIAGKGHEKYQEINGLKTYFDDIEELEKWLKN